MPRGYFIELLRCFGPHIFALWKAVLLRQRILFHSPPPIKRACRFVYCANVLSFTKVKYFRWDATPLFYVNINDMRMLQEQEDFKACTTETIFHKKFHLYDLFISKQIFHLASKEAEVPLMITEGDRSRYKYLSDMIATHHDDFQAEEHIIR